MQIEECIEEVWSLPNGKGINVPLLLGGSSLPKVAMGLVISWDWRWPASLANPTLLRDCTLRSPIVFSGLPPGMVGRIVALGPNPI